MLSNNDICLSITSYLVHYTLHHTLYLKHKKCRRNTNSSHHEQNIDLLDSCSESQLSISLALDIFSRTAGDAQYQLARTTFRWSACLITLSPPCFSWTCTRGCVPLGFDEQYIIQASITLLLHPDLFRSRYWEKYSLVDYTSEFSVFWSSWKFSITLSIDGIVFFRIIIILSILLWKTIYLMIKVPSVANKFMHSCCLSLWFINK